MVCALHQGDTKALYEKKSLNGEVIRGMTVHNGRPMWRIDNTYDQDICVACDEYLSQMKLKFMRIQYEGKSL